MRVGPKGSYPCCEKCLILIAPTTWLRHTAMESALNLPEILIAIFKYLVNAEDIVNAACVSTVWNRWAVDEIWMTNDIPIKAVLGLLGTYTKLWSRVEDVLDFAQHAGEGEADNSSNTADAQPRVSMDPTRSSVSIRSS